MTSPSEPPLLGVFTEGYPGLHLENLDLVEAQIGAIDWHAPLDIAEAPEAIDLLVQILQDRNIKLDAVVFGLPGEDYSSPAIARDTVGFAAPGAARRASRFRYARELIELVAKKIPAELFVRGVVTLKGHFGAFDEENEAEYRGLVACLANLQLNTLEPLNAILLAETGCEDADAVVRLIKRVSLGWSVDDLDSAAIPETNRLFCNWDTANLALWGSGINTFQYATILLRNGLLRGVHIKGGTPPTEAGSWGSECDPGAEFIAGVIATLELGTCFDGAYIVERELFLDGNRESQEDKARGLSRTLHFVATEVLAA